MNAHPKNTAQAGHAFVVDQDLESILVDLQQAHNADHVHECGHPALPFVAQVIEVGRDEADAEYNQQKRDHVRRVAGQEKSDVGDACPRSPDGVLGWIVRGYLVRGEIARIKRVECQQHKKGTRKQHNSKDWKRPSWKRSG